MLNTDDNEIEIQRLDTIDGQNHKIIPIHDETPELTCQFVSKLLRHADALMEHSAIVSDPKLFRQAFKVHEALFNIQQEIL